jgi:hypothetical protein
MGKTLLAGAEHWSAGDYVSRRTASTADGVVLRAARGAGRMLRVASTVTIDEAFEAFLAEQRERLSPKTVRNYEDVVFLLRSSLNSYAYDSLDELELKRWQGAFDAGDEEAFTRLFGPDKVVEHLDEFLGFFMVRKVMAGEDLLRASGTVTKKLAAWMHEQGYISEQERVAAVARGADAGRKLPRADRLGRLLFEEREKTPRLDPDDVGDENWVEDFLTIERVEPRALWFEGGIGPLRVSKEASDIAEVGWGVNIVVARLRSKWHIVELGLVYP